MRGSVHWGCVVYGRIVNQIVGHSGLQGGGQPWQLVAGRRQHDVVDRLLLVKQWWTFLVMLRIGRETGIGAAVKAARGRVGAVEVRLANGPTGGDMIMALVVGQSWQEWAIGGCRWNFRSFWPVDDIRRIDNLASFVVRGRYL